MFVGVSRIRLRFAESRSLKAKRQGVRSIVERIRARFNAAVSEVGDLNDWKLATLGIAVVGSDSRQLQSVLDKILAAIESMYLAPVVERQIEIFDFEDELGE